MIKGFTTAGAFHILSAQLPSAFGLKLKSDKSRLFKIASVSRFSFGLIKVQVSTSIYSQTIWRISVNYMLINWASVVITAVGITFIYCVKTYINDKFKKQMRNIPIPAELIVVILVYRQ